MKAGPEFSATTALALDHLRGVAGPLVRLKDRVDYYRNPDVRARILEFLGGNGQHQPTCHYLTAGDETAAYLNHRWLDSALGNLLDHGFEIFRSLWDETSLLADFDVEYVNFDDPAAAFIEPERIFELQQPVAETIARLLRDYGIAPLHLLSGRGHHFVWRIRRDSEPFRRLVDLGRGPHSLWTKEVKSHRPEGKTVPEELARAFAGLGLIMEFLAYQTKEIAAAASAIPVELTALEVGPSERGREMISLDISEYRRPAPYPDDASAVQCLSQAVAARLGDRSRRIDPVTAPVRYSAPEIDPGEMQSP